MTTDPLLEKSSLILIEDALKTRIAVLHQLDDIPLDVISRTKILDHISEMESLKNLITFRLAALGTVDQEVYDQFIKIVSDHLGLTAAEITAQSSFEGDLGADSLDTIELMITAEQEFEIVLLDSEVENIRTIREAVILIQQKLTERK